MHPSTSLLIAAAASAAAAQVNVVHVLETLQMVPRGSSQNVERAAALLGRQDATDEECSSSLQDFVKDMPTLPASVASYVETAAEPTDACTQALPMSFSKPIVDAVSSFVDWGADHSEEAIAWMERCAQDDIPLGGDQSGIANPGDLILTNCTGEPVLLFTDAKTTATVEVISIINDARDRFLASLTGGDASETGSAAATDSAAESAATNSGSQDAASTTGSDESAASGAAAESTGAGGDGSGAVRLGMTGAGVAAVAGFAGLLVSL